MFMWISRTSVFCMMLYFNIVYYLLIYYFDLAVNNKGTVLIHEKLAG